ncbi:MAG TPA: hypothetical protein PL048_04215, partial [Leptospiraceae bacterium]|nr:hypothetical protein [Leptospiraceae bacterium]
TIQVGSASESSLQQEKPEESEKQSRLSIKILKQSSRSLRDLEKTKAGQYAASNRPLLWQNDF